MANNDQTHEAAAAMPADAYCYRNGFVMVFDPQGNQLPELQGVYGREALIAFERQYPECRVLRNFHWDKSVWVDPETNEVRRKKPEAAQAQDAADREEG